VKLRSLFILPPITFHLLFSQVNPSMYQSMKWRMIGPHRGGRTVAAVGVPQQPNVFYIGVNNGGVWRTSDFGRTWMPIFDDQPTGSIGTLAVAPSDPNIIYVGTGEGLQRPDLSVGDGMFKSTDGGKSWKFLGLSDAQQVGSIIIDPKDPNRLFVAVLGHPYGANEQRGVFRSTDGGVTWQKVLYKDENTGAIALSFDPKSSQVIYADLWSARQGPWENGAWQGKTSGLFKSVDGGTTWRQLTKGLPTVEEGLGRIGFSVAPSDSSRIFATVDAPKAGGIYRSDDAGQSWTFVNGDGRIWGRGSDFAEIKVDPKNRDILYIANVASYKSTDAGKTWVCWDGAPGGNDYHGVWINPDNSDIAMLTADQGAIITVNGGETWSSWYNQPTAQFYHVITDDQFPYNVYGGQQESGSAMVSSRGGDGQITFREWHPVGSDEYGYVAPDPLNPNIVYGGRVTRFDKTTGQVQNVAPEAIRSGKYRVLRTMPLIFSLVDKRSLYFATNVLWKTTNGGTKWDSISPDLSREQTEVPENIGIYRSEDMKSMRRRGVIYAVAPSYKDSKVIWAGTDDGLVHVTWDGGKKWTNVTPPSITSWSKISQIDAGRFDAKTAYVSVNRFRLDDLKPHIFKTHDGGKTWTEIVSGFSESGPVNAVREDPVLKGLLFAGTEKSVYFSLDNGDHWQSLRQNLPVTSIRDLVVHNDDVVVGTHGRSFWILDDITPLRQITGGTGTTALFKPQDAYRVRWNQYTDTPLPKDEPAGQNPPDGAIINYFLAENVNEVTLEIFDKSNKLVRRYSSSDPELKMNEQEIAYAPYWVRPAQRLSANKGMQRFVWDGRYTPPQGFRRWLPISATYKNTAIQPLGPWVEPGELRVKLTVEGKSFTQPLTVKMDPRVKATKPDLQAQARYSMQCYENLQKLYPALTGLQAFRSTIKSTMEKLPTGAMRDSLASLERKAISISGQSNPDEVDIVYTSVSAAKLGEETISGTMNGLNYLLLLMQNADAAPTSAQIASVKSQTQIAAQVMKRRNDFLKMDVAPVNEGLKRAGFDPLKVE